MAIRVAVPAILATSRLRVEAIKPETKDPASAIRTQTAFTSIRAFLQASKSSNVIVLIFYLRPQRCLFSSQILDDGDHLIGNPVAEATKRPQ